MTLYSIANQPGIMDVIAGKVIESILQSREIAFIACADGSIHDQASVSKWNGVNLPDFDPEKTCNGKEASIIHTHVVSSSLPSLRDVASYGLQFTHHHSLKEGCSAGIDGVFCIGRDGNMTREPFTGKQERMILEKARVDKWIGEQVFCDKLVDGKKNYYACSIQDLGRVEKTMGIFKEVSFHGGSSWIGDEQSDVSMFISLPSLQIECFGARDNGMQLSCVATGRKERP